MSTKARESKAKVAKASKKAPTEKPKPIATENDFEFKCPVDGFSLVERKSRYGTFLGCTNFPKCKYTFNIDHIPSGSRGGP